MLYVFIGAEHFFPSLYPLHFDDAVTLTTFFFLQGNVNVAIVLVSLQEITEFMVKPVNVMIDSVQIWMALSVEVCINFNKQ